MSELEYPFDSDDYRVSNMISDRPLSELEYPFDSDVYRVSNIISNRHVNDQ